MRKTTVNVMYYPASEDIFFGGVVPAQWAVAVDFIEDNNPMSASMHEYGFVAKPTAKQIRQCKRKALAEHVSDLSQFKLDYPHYFE